MPGIAEDRISDLTASVIKRWLAEFTERRCKDFGIPTTTRRLVGWDAVALDWRPFDARLPQNPSDGSPVLLAPLDLLRRLPWINYGDYYRTTYASTSSSCWRASPAGRDGGPHHLVRAVNDTLRFNLDTSVVDAAYRALAREPSYRPLPLVCTDSARRYVRVVRMEAVVKSLAVRVESLTLPGQVAKSA